MSALAASPAYSALLTSIPPRVIRTEEQNEAYLTVLDDLESRPSLTAEEDDLAELLTLLIEDFEDKHYALPNAKPGEVLAFLLDQHGLSLDDLNAALRQNLGEPNIIQNSDAQHLTTEQIRWLSARFHVSPEVFF